MSFTLDPEVAEVLPPPRPRPTARTRLPGDEDAVRLWDDVVGLAAFPGPAELKRSLRERPQLRSFGVDAGQVEAEEDWQKPPPAVTPGVVNRKLSVLSSHRGEPPFPGTVTRSPDPSASRKSDLGDVVGFGVLAW